MSSTSPDSVSYPAVGYGLVGYTDGGSGFANYLTLDGAAAGSTVTVQARGLDADIDLTLAAKGAGLIRWAGGLSIGGNVFGNSATALPRVKSSWTLAGGYTGSGTNGIHLHELLLNTGNYSVGTAGTLINTYIGSAVSGSLATGDHVALQAEVAQTAATPNLGEYLVAAVLQATANSNAGGTAITTNGSVFGANVIAQIKTGATYFNSVIGAEVDIVAKEAVLDKIGLALVPWVGDTTSGSRTDALLVFGRNVSSSVGMDYGAVFGSPLGWWPIKSTGTLIGAPYTENASLPPGPSRAAAWGVDFSPVAFSGGFLKGPGFQVDGSGNTTTGSALANYLTLSGAASLSYPTISASGSDADIDVLLSGKGTGRANSAKLYVGASGARSVVNTAQTVYIRNSTSYTTTPTAGFQVAGNFSGTITSGTGDYNLIAIDNDNVDPTTGSGPKGTTGFRVGHSLTGGKGGRVAFSAGLFITGAFTADATGAGSFQTAGGFRATASASAGGTAGFGNGRGNLFGINPIVELNSGAGLYWQQIAGGEITLKVATGTGVNYKVGWQVVQAIGDTVAGGSGYDIGYNLSNQTGGTAAIGWDVGYAFGCPWGWWPMKATGTMIGTGGPGFAGGPAYAAAYGIDFSAVTFSSGFLKSTGFLVDGSGNTTVASAILGTSGPEILTGSGVPASTKPKGSLYLRTGGAVGSTLYVSQGGGTWNAVAGV